MKERENTAADIQIYQKKLRKLASELSLAEARQRREIASDLHDHIGQALAYVSQKISYLQGNTVFSGMESDFSEIMSILHQTIQYTRNLTVEISPPVLYEFGLYQSIEWLADRFKKQHDIKVKITKSGKPKDPSEDIKVFIFKAVQELLNNVKKHSGASKVYLKTEWNENDFTITVIDNGAGIDFSEYEKRLSDECCFGLFSIRERLSYIGGSFSIESKAAEGTTVTLNTPYRLSGGDSA